MPNPLDDLLRDAMKAKAAKPPKRRDPIKVTITSNAMQSIPNWVPGRRISLVHVSELGRETFVGVFQEYHWPAAGNARRLVPVGLTESIDAVETVTGDHWLVPQSPKRKDTAQEIEALRKRFFNLIGI